MPLISLPGNQRPVDWPSDEVLVFVDRGDVQEPPPVSEGLNQWNRRIGDLVLYEVSPLSEPVLLDRFAEP